MTTPERMAAARKIVEEALIEAITAALASRDEEIARLLAAGSPNDLRMAGWAVAVHNDYQLDGEPHTFWLFTQGSRCAKGEGRTDAEALDQVRAAIVELGSK